MVPGKVTESTLSEGAVLVACYLSVIQNAS